MANDDLRKIKELLEVVGNKVGKLETHVSLHSSTMHAMKDQQSVMNEKLDNIDSAVKEMSENVDAARGDIESLHIDVKAIREKQGMYHSRNKREIDEIKTHLGLPLMPDAPQV